MKKTIQLTLLLITLLSLTSIKAFAYDIAVENEGVTIYYSYIIDGTELMVTYHEYTDFYKSNYKGNVVIPEEVTYMSRTRKVTSIGARAFTNCSGLTSVTIPNTVTNIESAAFYCCSGLTSITIPNSVTSIGNEAFNFCDALTSVHTTDIASWCKISFEDSFSNPLSYAQHLYLNGMEVKDLVIPNSVTSIGDCAFVGCSSLTSVTIPNSVTSIGRGAFSDCI